MSSNIGAQITHGAVRTLENQIFTRTHDIATCIPAASVDGLAEAAVHIVPLNMLSSEMLDNICERWGDIQYLV
jgi:hypothetical protein